ncbi:MAG: hypothetical protein OJJ21_02795 [Ferrovibrio sp.]|uniref:hypothetical protein n=1 Tax=Ferrovibrio sp. TaxID=1917215 RepID=UPI00261B9193|nr:hypothetical protein [Ferrovibrio sp.]MCW0232506.1 hypothetical protein [Ferrovibrio sp.]
MKPHSAFRIIAITLVAALSVAFAAPVLAQDKHAPKAQAWAEKTLREWMKDPVVIEAVKAQNAKHAGLTQDKVDALDKQWRAETKASAKPLINEVMGNPLSAFLKKKEAEGKGLVTEIFVMDNKGLNVGQSDVTSDYWQGDEAKWQKTFSVGPAAVFVDKVDKDESTQKFQTQVSISIVDPAGGAVIGAVTVGLDVEMLMEM